jgi:hypothetical protein
MDEETPEGHALRFDSDGSVIGLTIINARWLLEHDGEIVVTLPEQVRVEPATLEPLFAAAEQLTRSAERFSYRVAVARRAAGRAGGRVSGTWATAPASRPRGPGRRGAMSYAVSSDASLRQA